MTLGELIKDCPKNITITVDYLIFPEYGYDQDDDGEWFWEDEDGGRIYDADVNCEENLEDPDYDPNDPDVIYEYCFCGTIHELESWAENWILDEEAVEVGERKYEIRK